MKIESKYIKIELNGFPSPIGVIFSLMLDTTKDLKKYINEYFRLLSELYSHLLEIK